MLEHRLKGGTPAYADSRFEVFKEQLPYLQEEMREGMDEETNASWGELSHLRHMSRHKDRRTSKSAGSRYTDSHTICISSPRWSLWFEPKEHQNAPWLEKFLPKEWVSWILFVHLSCHSEILLYFFCSTKVGEKSDMAKSWATFCWSGTYKKC